MILNYIAPQAQWNFELQRWLDFLIVGRNVKHLAEPNSQVKELSQKLIFNPCGVNSLNFCVICVFHYLTFIKTPLSHLPQQIPFNQLAKP